MSAKTEVAAGQMVTKTIVAQNVFTEGMAVSAGVTVSISISGVSDSTVTVQRRLDDSNWRDVKDYTVSSEESFVTDEACDVRIGIKTGNYGSDTVVCRAGQGK